ncbi:hypothetical protein Tco_1237845 [Tanacetum coccineum]
MIPGTDLHQFDIHNDGYFSHLPLTYVDGVILEMVVRKMPYKEFVVYLEEKCGCYFQDLSEYLSQAITYDMDVCVSKTIGPPKKSTRNIDKGIDATDGVEARTSTTDKGAKRSDDDSDYQSDKSVDYLSPGEEELT